MWFLKDGWMEGGAKRGKMGDEEETNHSTEQRWNQEGRSPIEEETDCSEDEVNAGG